MIKTISSKLTLFASLASLLALLLAACAPAAPAATPTPAATPASAAAAQANNRPLPLEEKLVVGTLVISGSNVDITSDQARKLLPLWQQVQTLSADANTTAAQLQAVYTQIQGDMTFDQMQAINAITFSDVQNEMQKLGIQFQGGQFGAGGPGGAGGGGANSPQRETRVAELQTATAQGTPNPGGGGFGFRNGTPGTPDPTREAELLTATAQGTPEPGGFIFRNGTPNPTRIAELQTATALGTPNPGGGFGGGGGGFANMFLGPLIQMLQKKAGS